MALLPSPHRTSAKAISANHNPTTTIRKPISLVHSISSPALIRALLAATVFHHFIALIAIDTLIRAYFLAIRVLAVKIFLIATLFRYILSPATILALSFATNAIKLALGAFGSALKIVSKTLYKHTERIQRQIFFNFMVWILNPYAVYLFIFWPGWILVGSIWVGIRICSNVWRRFVLSTVRIASISKARSGKSWINMKASHAGRLCKSWGIVWCRRSWIASNMTWTQWGHNWTDMKW